MIPHALRLARWRAQRWLRGQVIHRLGLDKEYPPIGQIRAGDLVFEVTHVQFRDGRMFVHGVAGVTEHGRMAGVTRILGTDGVVSWVGDSTADMGIKTAGSTWKYTYETILVMPATPE